MVQAGCSCVRVAVCRAYCAANAIAATATVAGTAVAWRTTRPGARAHAATNGLGGAGLPTPSGRGAGANGAVRAVMVATAVVVVLTCSRT